MRRLAGSLLLLVLLGSIAAPAGAHYIELRGRLVEDGVLTLGLALTGRPFAYREDGRLRGFEVDFAAEVAQSRGLALRVEQVPRRRLVEALVAGEVDAIGTLALSEDAPPGMATLPFLFAGDHMMVLKANPFRIRDAADLAGHTVSTHAGTTAEAFAREINERLIAEGRKPIHVHSFPNQRDVHFPVSMGHAAAYFVKTASALAPTLDPASRVGVLSGVFQPRREVGFGVLDGNPALRDAVAHAIAAKVANGAYDRLRAHHGIPDDLSPFR